MKTFTISKEKNDNFYEAAEFEAEGWLERNKNIQIYKVE